MHKICSHTPLHTTTRSVTPRPYTSGVQTLIHHLPNNSQGTTLLTPICISQLQIFFKVKFHIYCSICEGLNHLTSVKLHYHLFRLLSFLNKLLMKFLSVVSLAPFFPLSSAGFITWFYTVQWCLGTHMSHYGRTDCNVNYREGEAVVVFIYLPFLLKPGEIGDVMVKPWWEALCFHSNLCLFFFQLYLSLFSYVFIPLRQ